MVADMRTGVLVLQIMDTMRPGSVAWAKVNMNPINVYQRVQNCNYAVTLGTWAAFKLVAVALSQ